MNPIAAGENLCGGSPRRSHTCADRGALASTSDSADQGSECRSAADHFGCAPVRSKAAWALLFSADRLDGLPVSIHRDRTNRKLDAASTDCAPG
jgi:hypothetical protein